MAACNRFTLWSPGLQRGEWKCHQSTSLALDRWVPGGLLSCTNWIMWRRNKLSSSIHATDYPQSGKEKRQRVQTEAEGGMVGYDGVQEKSSPEKVSPNRLAHPSAAECSSRRQVHRSHLLPPRVVRDRVKGMETLLLLLSCFSHVQLCVTPQMAAHQCTFTQATKTYRLFVM